MTAGVPHAPTIGAHPLTGKLVGALRRSGGTLTFAADDLARFLAEGRSLDPAILLVWVRDLSTLAVTLRNDLMAGKAAEQLEHSLIDPLCRLLEEQGHSEAAKPPSGSAVDALVKAERKRRDKGAETPVPIPAESTVSTYLRRRRTRKSP